MPDVLMRYYTDNLKLTSQDKPNGSLRKWDC